jgi:exonuclease VII small subunit
MIDVAIDGYQASRQVDILKTLREVVNRLESLAEEDRLDTAIEDLNEGADIRAALQEIVQWADEHRGLLDDDG